MFKKMVSLILAVFLLLSLAAGCGTKTEPKQESSSAAVQTASTTSETTANTPDYSDTGGLILPVVDKPVTVTWMITCTVADINDKSDIKELRKRTGVDLQIQPIADAKTTLDKINVLIASNQLPDIFYGVPLPQINDLGAKGALVPINKYADMLPNFKKLYMEENPSVMKSYTDEKGDLYTWPIYGVARDVNHGFLYRKDIFDKNGIKEWTNTDEFYEALKKLKEIYPESIPFVSKRKEAILQDFAYGWGLGSLSWPCCYDEASKKWQFVGTSPAFKDMLDFMRKLYTEGLLDPEFMTDADTSWTAKMTEKEKAFATFDWIGRLDMFRNQVKDKIPEYDLRYANPIGPVGKIRRINKISIFGLAVSNNKNKEAALKLMDYMTSPSGSELMTMGIKDLEFTLDANGKPVYPGLKDVPKVDISTLMATYGSWAESLYLKADPRSVYFNYTEREQEAQDKMVKNNKIEDSDPVLKFTNEENEALTELRNNLKTELDVFSTQYILAKTVSEQDWTDWTAKANKLGAQTMAYIYNQAQNRYDSAK